MDLSELLSGTDFEGISSTALLTWARGRSEQLIAELPPRAELVYLLPAHDRIARGTGSSAEREEIPQPAETRASTNEDKILPSSANGLEVELVDDEVELLEDVTPQAAGDRAEELTVAAVVASVTQPMPPAPPPREPRLVRVDDYESPVLERARDSLEFGIPGAEPEPEPEAEPVTEDRLFSPEERESIGFAIDDALSAAIVEGIPPEESWKLPMEFQDTSGFQQIGRLPEASFSEPAEPGSSGSFERGIPEESGTYDVEEAANEPSGPLQAAVGSSVASLAFLQDDDD